MTTEINYLTALAEARNYYAEGDSFLEEVFDQAIRWVKAEAWDEGFHATRLGDYDHVLRDYPEADENPYL